MNGIPGKSLNYSRFWAQKQGKTPTGGGGGRGGFFGGGGGLKMVGGTKTTAELIAGCERGILVTHFFYVNFLDPRTVMMTGLTRDGLWLIERGESDDLGRCAISGGWRARSSCSTRSKRSEGPSTRASGRCFLRCA